MSDFGLVNTIKAPRLHSVVQSKLIEFDNDYVAYKDKVEDVNRSRDTSRRITPASIRQCMKPKLLNSLCILGDIENATSLEEATDETVKKWFDDKVSSAPISLTERIWSAVDSVKFKVNQKDPAGSVEEYVLDIISALDDNNASEIVNDTEIGKFLVNKLISKLQPSELQERVRILAECWSAEQKASVSYFRKVVSELAVAVIEGEVARTRAQRKQRKRPQVTQDEQKANNLKKQRTGRDEKGSKSFSKPKNAVNKEWNLPCLNKNCKEKHHFNQCKNTPESEKQKIWDAWREERKAKNEKRYSAVSVQEVQNTSRKDIMKDGRYRLIVENKVPLIVLGDYGSDTNAISFSSLQKVMNVVPGVKYKSLETPVTVSVAVSSKEEPSTFSASNMVDLSITIIIPGSNLPVRIHNVPFFVIDQEMHEALLGREFLKKIGFNLDEHLQRVSSLIDGKDFEQLNAEDIQLSSASYSGIKYNAVEDDPIELPRSIDVSFGTDNPSEIDTAFEEIMQSASSNGMTQEGQTILRQLLIKYRDVFRIKLGIDPPAKVAPLQIELKSGSKPCRAPQRRYAPKQRNFLIKTIQKLEKVNVLYKNPTSKWASPALAVPKPDTDELRFTVDLRGPNSRTLPVVSAMPHLESQFQYLQGSTCYAKVDMAHAYWQLPLSKDSQEILSIQTPLGVFSSNRVLQGGTDSGNHFQAVTEEAFHGLSQHKLQWMDDFLLHHSSEAKLLMIFEEFLKVCEAYGFKVHAKKTFPFLRETKFCGRIITPEGVQFDPRNLEAITKMPRPVTGGQLQQLLCATNWMRSSIQNYAKLISPLHDLLEQIYKVKGSRTKRAVSKHPLHKLWGNEHDDAYASLKQQLACSTKLAYPEDTYTLCLFTDASEEYWASVLTQIPSDDIKKTIEDQRHQPLAFLSGCFTGNSAGWSMPEKEGYAVVESMIKLDYLTYGRTVSIFTDHANLVYIFDPYGRNPGIPRHTASKLMRWALKLSSFRYIIEHVAGARNVWADMLSRWAAKPIEKVNALRVNAMLVAPVAPHFDEKYDWPSLKDIEGSQQKSSTDAPKRFNVVNGILQDKNKIIWIPASDTMLKLRILIAGHTGLSGHRGIQSTASNVKEHFFWNKMDTEIESFVRSCLHCLLTRTGEVVSRPLGHGLHAEKPNELIHFDFCYIMNGEKDFTYVLIIKDDLSGYVWLIPTIAADAVSAANGLISWFASFTVVDQWVSDQGSHFKNEVVKQLRDRLNTAHHFTLAYSPWSNGTVERVCRELLRSLKAILSEFQLPLKAWPSAIPLVQSVLNTTKLQRFGNRSPLTVFTGQKANTPLLAIKRSTAKHHRIYSLKEIKARQLANVESLHTALDQMHREVKMKSDAKRNAEVQRHNVKTNVRAINFIVGDYVLRGIFKNEKGRKPALTWRGPYKVIACKSEYIFTIQHLLTKSSIDVHGRRLMFFRNSSFQVTEDVLQHLSYQENEYLIVHDFEDIKKEKEEILLKVMWKGFDTSESSWVSMQSLLDDVPDLVRDYILDIKRNGTSRQRKLASSVHL